VLRPVADHDGRRSRSSLNFQRVRRCTPFRHKMELSRLDGAIFTDGLMGSEAKALKSSLGNFDMIS
jgi:hypothetical protein